MRKAIVAVLIGYGVVAATAPAFACTFTQTSADQAKSQQTASAAQDTSSTKSQ